MRISDWSADVCSSDLAHHVAAVRTADDADAIGVNPVERGEVLLRVDDVLQVHFAVLPVVHVAEGLAVAGRAAVVGREPRVAVVHQVLDGGGVAAAALAARATVHPYQRRHLVARPAALRPVLDSPDSAIGEATYSE